MATNEEKRFLSVPIGDVVKAWRQERGWTVSEFAARIGKRKGYVSLLEHGRIDQPRAEQLALLASALNISVEDIVLRHMPDTSTTSVQKMTPGSSGAEQRSKPSPVVELQQEELAAAIERINAQLDRLSDQLDRLSDQLATMQQILKQLVAYQKRQPRREKEIGIIGEEEPAPPERPRTVRPWRSPTSGSTNPRTSQPNTPDHSND